MKTKILTTLLLILIILCVVAIGYDTVFTSPGRLIEIKNIYVREYSGGYMTNSYFGGLQILSALKGQLLSWYSSPPTEVLNQYQTSYTPGDYPLDSYVAQTFIPDGGGKITKIEIFRKVGIGTSASGTVEIREASGGTPTSTVLASQSFSFTSTQDQWITIVFDNPASVVDGQEYALVFHITSGTLGWIHYNGDAYSRGKALRSSDGSTWSEIATTEDMAFKIYTVGEVLDQQATGKSAYSQTDGTTILAQTFTPSMSGRLTTLKLYMATYPSSGSRTLTVEIRTTDANGIPTGTVLASEQYSFLGTAKEHSISLSSPPTIQAGVKYAIVLKDDTTSTLFYIRVYRGGDIYSGGQGYSSSDGTAWSDVGGDFYFKVYIDTGTQISSFQVSFDYSINPAYSVAYKNDVGKTLNTFNYTINIYHNVDNNQTWILAYSESYSNMTAISTTSYVSPWISLLTGSYSTGTHNYYYKIEIVAEAYDTLSGQKITDIACVILSDQFYWQSYMSFNGQLQLVDTNMSYRDYFAPTSMILLIMVVAGYFVVRKRMMEKD